MILLLLLQVVASNITMIVAKKSGEKEQYIVMAKNKKDYNQLTEEVSDNISEEPSLLTDNNMLIAELTEEEVEDLTEEGDVIVEPNIEVTANKEFAKNELVELFKESKKLAKKNREWNAKAIEADRINDNEIDAEQKVKVAILDSGVDFVPGVDVKSKINLTDDKTSDFTNFMYQDLTGHGTGIAGIIASKGDIGVMGVNPNAELYSIRVMEKSNTASVSRIVEGIYWCIENNINIINMSFGTHVYSEILENAVKDAYNANILMVGAAGNDHTSVEYPAAFPQVVAVASTDTNSEISAFSNEGDEIEVAAPGEHIKTAGEF
jgi:minor extracellular protease Epr